LTVKSRSPRRGRTRLPRVPTSLFAVLLYVIQVLYQKPGPYGALLAVGLARSRVAAMRPRSWAVAGGTPVGPRCPAVATVDP
jgi:hypothetical protein